MSEIVVRRWSDSSDEALTEAAIRARHPQPIWRVSRYHYPPDVMFQGSARAGTCYVVSGSVRFVYDGEVTLRAGELAELPEGGFSLEVIGDDELVIVQCWKLPFPSSGEQ